MFFSNNESIILGLFVLFNILLNMLYTTEPSHSTYAALNSVLSNIPITLSFGSNNNFAGLLKYNKIKK